jgi:hypothetical protein
MHGMLPGEQTSTLRACDELIQGLPAGDSAVQQYYPNVMQHQTGDSTDEP